MVNLQLMLDAAPSFVLCPSSINTNNYTMLCSYTARLVAYHCLSDGSTVLLSILLLQYLCSVPLLTLRPWAFGAHDCSGGLACYCLVWHMIPCLFLLQIPLAYLTSFPFMRGQLGNVIVWASIVLGQPLAILMYMVEYYRWDINWSHVLATPQLSISWHSIPCSIIIIQ